MTDPVDMFSEEPPKNNGGRWTFVKKPWFVLAFAVFLVAVVLIFSVNQIMRTLLHSRPEVSVPNIQGKSLPEALQIVSTVDLSLQHDSTEFDETLPAGTVINQQPQSGMRVRSGRSIRVVVSRGGRASFVPDVMGKRLAEAQSVLAAEGIQLGAINESFSTDQSKGIVLGQHPSSGTVVTRGAMVDLEVSKGPPPSGLPLAPDFSGKSSDEAAAWATSVGAPYRIKEEPKAIGAAGTVVRQEPPPGQPLLEGQELVLTIVPLSGGNAARLTFDVPSDVDDAQVRVIARDNRGESQIYEGRHEGGESVDVPVAVNTTTRFRIYVNDVLQEERVVEP